MEHCHIGHAWARDSFHDVWSHLATPRLERIAHASSTTTMIRFRCCDRTALCSHAPPQAISTPRAGEWYTVDRSSTTSGPSSRNPGVVGPSNMPQRSPLTSRRSSNATSRPSSSKTWRVSGEPAMHRHRGARRRRLPEARWAPAFRPPATARWPHERGIDRRRLRGRRSRPRQATARDEVSTARLLRASPTRSTAIPPPTSTISSSTSSGLSRIVPPGRRATGVTPQAVASGPYSLWGR